MKTCNYCGLQNLDEAIQCVTCHTALVTPPRPSVPEARVGPAMSAQECHFWEHLTLRQLAILIIRVQALWLLLSAVVETTYLPTYFSRLHADGSDLFQEPKRNLMQAIFRIVLPVAAAVAVIQYTERLLSWLAKDWIHRPRHRSQPLVLPAPRPNRTTRMMAVMVQSNVELTRIENTNRI
jgi:hypothetical protein